jgi:L-threonylcarbamoyladenylate synthase
MLREIVPDAIAAVASGADLNVGHDDTVGRVGPYDGSVAPSPGLLSKHYAPRAPLTLYEGPRDRVAARMADDAQALEMAGKRVGMLTWGDRPAQSVAAEMYAALREMDAAGVDVILASAVDGSDGLVPALLDRLRRAAAGRVVRP